MAGASSETFPEHRLYATTHTTDIVMHYHACTCVRIQEHTAMEASHLLRLHVARLASWSAAIYLLQPGMEVFVGEVRWEILSHGLSLCHPVSILHQISIPHRLKPKKEKRENRILVRIGNITHVHVRLCTCCIYVYKCFFKVKIESNLSVVTRSFKNTSL